MCGLEIFTFGMAASVVARGRRPYWGTKIVAIGKNYAAHKVEMGGTPERPAEPVFFFKPNSSVVHEPLPIVRPTRCTDLHHEVELGVVLSKRAQRVPAANWREYVAGYVVALDMTARDDQAKAKKDGMPWSLSKGMDTFCAMSGLVLPEELADPEHATLWCAVDGEERQRGSTAEMLFSIPELLEFLSGVMTLEEGDVILTGTPSGVGPVLPGQTITGGIDGIVDFAFPIVQEEE
jgi:acylpyruvate hydrolase